MYYNHSVGNTIFCEKSIKKSLYIQKLNVETHKDYKNYLKEYYSNPNIFLNSEINNSPIIVGKRHLESNKFPFQYTKTIKNVQTKRQLKKSPSKNRSMSNTSFSEINKSITKNERKNIKINEDTIKEKLITDTELDNIYKSFKVTNSEKLITFNSSLNLFNKRRLNNNERNISRNMSDYILDDIIQPQHNFTFKTNTIERDKRLNSYRISLKKQNEYIDNRSSLITQFEMKKKLAEQENALLNQKRHKIYLDKIRQKISRKINKPINELIMDKDEDNRIKQSKKNKLNILLENYKSDKNFLNFQKIKDNYINSQNPNIHSNENKLYTKENKYLVKLLPKNNINPCLDFLNQNHFNGLQIKGRNLLNLEQEISKKIKGKKYLRNILYDIKDKENILFKSKYNYPLIY